MNAFTTRQRANRACRRSCPGAGIPDTVTLRREDAEGLLHCWSEEPDFGDADRAITARVRAALGWGDDSE